MTISYSVVLKNARLDQIETTIGTAPLLQVYNGSVPANSDANLAGNVLLANGALPSDWLAAASGGSKAKAGTWTITGNASLGSAQAGSFFRILNSAGNVVTVQGTFTATGGGGDMTVDNNSIAANQSITVNTFNITAGN